MGRSRSWSLGWSRSRFFQAGVGVAEIWSTPQPWMRPIRPNWTIAEPWDEGDGFEWAKVVVDRVADPDCRRYVRPPAPCCVCMCNPPAIRSAGNTSVGPDKLHYSFFRHLPAHSKLFILQTFNDLFSNHVFPNSWKESIVVALLKPGKARQDPGNYRPIAMSSCLGKLLERMASKRLTYILEHKNLLSKYNGQNSKYKFKI